MTDVNQLITDHLDIWTSATEKKSSAGRGNGGVVGLYGLQKLRDLILKLAVRGKLVPQDESEGSGAKLKERVLLDRGAGMRAKRVRKQKPLPDVEPSEVPYKIPPSWTYIRLGDLTNYGVTDKAEAKDVNEETWVLELEDIEKVSSRLLQRVVFAERRFKSSKNRFKKGDVIYGKLRPYLDKVLVADQDGVCTTEMVPLRPYADVSSEFVRIVLKSPEFIRYADDSTHGMNLPRLGTEKARMAVIPLPPTAEQHRIVAKVDELMGLCDALERQAGDNLKAHQTLVEVCLSALSSSQTPEELSENWSRLEANFDTLFTTEESIDRLERVILELGVSGRLVQQGKSEPADVLLKRTQSVKKELVAQKKALKPKKLQEIEARFVPKKLPEGWVLCQLQDLIVSMDAGWSPACSAEPSPNDDTWGVLKTTSVQPLVYWEHENKVLPDRLEPREQYEVEAGDILITRAGPKNRVAICCAVEKTRPRLMISDKIIRFHMVDVGISSRFIAMALNVGNSSDYLENSKSGMAESQMNISQDKLKATPICLPPVEEQEEIVKRVDELLSVCRALRSAIPDANAMARSLADSLTAKIH